MLRKICMGLLGIVFVVQMNGCVALVGAAAGGAGTATWLGGKLMEDVNTTMERSHRASRSATKALGMTVTKETVKDSVIQLVGQTEFERPFWIDITPVTSKQTRIAVRVGVPGDKEASQELLDRILSYL
ncbi:MAG: DUF3568 family protein [Candidatus Omnitrophota bacterium]